MKKLLAVLSIFAFGFGLASCGSKTTKQENVNLDENGVPTENVTVTFWHTMGKTNQVLLDRWIDEFQTQYPNIKIEHAAQGGYDDINDKIRKAIPANTYPTMAFAYPDHVADYLGRNYENSKVVALNALMDHEVYGINKADYVAAYLEEGLSYGTDTYYSMPYSKSTEVLFYNKTFFDKHNLTVPSTWAEFETVAAQIKQIDNSKVALGYDSDDNLFITMAAQLGNPYTSATGENYVFDVKANHDMVSTLKTWYDNGWLTTKSMLDGAYTSDKFKAQEIYMSVGSTGGTKYNLPNKDDEGNYEFDAAVAPLPQWNLENGKAISQGPSICFFKKSTAEVLAAWAFYKYITNASNSAEWALETGYNPVNSASYDIPGYKELLDTDDLFGRVANVTKTMDTWYFVSPAFRGSSTARKTVGAILPKVFNEKASVEEAFAEALALLQF